MADREIAEKEIGEQIVAAVALLPEDQKTVFILSEYQELSYAEVAVIMKCSAKSVESRLYRAKQFCVTNWEICSNDPRSETEFTIMKVRESGMSEAGLWHTLFEPEAILDAMGLTGDVRDAVDFGCGYGTFAIPAAKWIQGTLHGFDIDPAMIEASRRLAEQNGWVDRARLLAIRGRSRSEQLALAKQEGVELFGCPSGGCLLTDPVVVRRLKDVFCFCPDYDLRDAKLATFGRHFRLHSGLKAVMGRNQEENERLARLGTDWPALELADFPGPVMALRGTMLDGDRVPLGRLLHRYAPKVTADPVTVRWTCGDQREQWVVSGSTTDQELDAWRI